MGRLCRGRWFIISIVAFARVKGHAVGAKEDLQVAGHGLKGGVGVGDKGEVVKVTHDPNGNMGAWVHARVDFELVVNALSISQGGAAGSVRDVHGVTKVKGVNIPDEHIQKNVEAEGGKGAALLATGVDGEGISEASKGASHAREAGLEGVNEGKARGVKTKSGEGIKEAGIRDCVKSLGDVSGKDMNWGISALGVLENMVEDSGSRVGGLAWARPALGV